MYKAVNKDKAIWNSMEASELHTGVPTINLEKNQFIFMLLKLKYLLLELNTVKFMSILYYNNFTMVFLLKIYDKYSVMPSYMCTKPCSGPIFSRSTKWMTEFRFYSTSDT